jgi:hypothetical protein
MNLNNSILAKCANAAFAARAANYAEFREVFRQSFFGFDAQKLLTLTGFGNHLREAIFKE